MPDIGDCDTGLWLETIIGTTRGPVTVSNQGRVLNKGHFNIHHCYALVVVDSSMLFIFWLQWILSEWWRMWSFRWHWWWKQGGLCGTFPDGKTIQHQLSVFWLRIRLNNVIITITLESYKSCSRCFNKERKERSVWSDLWFYEADLCSSFKLHCETSLWNKQHLICSFFLA